MVARLFSTRQALLCMFTFGTLIVSIIALSKDKLK
ncbi:putative holin-like toxin [Sedimentibacter hydroxybenzoicus]